MLSSSRASSASTLLRMSEVIAAPGGADRTAIAALSGPNLAGEIARGLPASAVVAAEDGETAVASPIGSGRREFRLYVNADIRRRRARAAR